MQAWLNFRLAMDRDSCVQLVFSFLDQEFLEWMRKHCIYKFNDGKLFTL